MDYIQNLRKIRTARGWSQVELSKAIGLGGSTYGLYETYQRKLDVDTLLKLCEVLQVTPNEALGFEEEG
ncbi:MAG TPA: helix-turn-helix transcriptional regulator [Candidatus Agathobaculum merdigallinarum]|nr:helix-turn-helix transcriptional regulator [Candidatus Agathobaculum merdigallinarum]